jgi:hypothetical protein
MYAWRFFAVCLRCLSNSYLQQLFVVLFLLPQIHQRVIKFGFLHHKWMTKDIARKQAVEALQLDTATSEAVSSGRLRGKATDIQTSQAVDLINTFLWTTKNSDGTTKYSVELTSFVDRNYHSITKCMTGLRNRMGRGTRLVRSHHTSWLHTSIYCIILLLYFANTHFVLIIAYFLTVFNTFVFDLLQQFTDQSWFELTGLSRNTDAFSQRVIMVVKGWSDTSAATATSIVPFSPDSAVNTPEYGQEWTQYILANAVMMWVVHSYCVLFACARLEGGGVLCCVCCVCISCSHTSVAARFSQDFAGANPQELPRVRHS